MQPQPLPRQGYKRPSAAPRTSKAFIIFTLILVMCLSITMGYLVTKYIVYPYILKQDSALEQQNPATSGGIVIDDNEIPNADQSDEKNGNNQIVEGGSSDADTNDADETPDSNAVTANPAPTPEPTPPAETGGYCLQFGNLSTRAAADELVAKLKAGGVSSKVAEVNGQFKILSDPYATKDEARSHLPAISTLVPDVFITTAQ